MSATVDIATSGAKWRFMGNLVQKLVSFLLNQLLIQYTTPEVLGTAAVQLELLLASILFLSREGIRLSVLRTVIVTKDDFYRIINISWIPSFLILCFIFGCSHYHYFNFTNTEKKLQSLSSPSFATILLYSIGALFESCGEPWLNIYQYNLFFTPRVSAEVIAVFIRSSVTFLTVAVFGMGVL